MSDHPPELDRDRTRGLVDALGQQVKAFYLANGRAQVHVFEALNALAAVTAMVVAGTEPFGTEDCIEFFSDAMAQQLRHSLAAIAARAEPDKGGDRLN